MKIFRNKILILMLLGQCLGMPNLRAQSNAIVTGLIKSNSLDTIELSFFPNINLEPSIEYVAFSEDGKFKFKLPSFTDLAYLSLSIRGERKCKLTFYLVEPGDSIFILVDSDSLRFEGIGSAKFKAKYEHDQKIGIAINNRSSGVSIGLYLDYLDSKESLSIKKLERYRDKISPISYSVLKADFVGYAEYKKMQNLIIAISNEGLNSEIKEIYKDRIEQYPFQIRPNDTIAYSMSYVDYLTQKAIVDELISSGRNTYSLTSYYQRLTDSYKGSLREKVLTFFIISNIDRNGLYADLELCIKKYMSVYKGGKYEALVKEKYLKAKRLSKGNLVYNFDLSDTNSNRVSLTSFTGKIVYIDFWASWCSPCRAEFKTAAPSLKEKFKGRDDIVFLYVSMDANEDAWKKAIRQDNIEGVHLIADNAMNGELAKQFLIYRIPRYMIIDKEGKILDNNATRPSNPSTYETLKRYLEQK